jgi:NAD(P)-dependent dehydrogenase (short-subunit alcohol dehydrogenase family)
MSQKVAYVTGGMGGIGTCICQRLHRDGFKVIAGCGPSRDHAKWIAEQKALGYTFHVSVGNVADWDSTVEAFKHAKEEHGPIDILVNNAGIQRRAPFESFPEETWREIMAANLDSVFHITQAVGARMLERRRGRIINICSVASELGRRTIVPYAATKGALRQMTRGLCAEWAGRNIQVNAIAPGYIKTEMNTALLADAAFTAWVSARTPAGRWADVEELAGAAIFLASDAASYVNGHILYVDGGLSTSV